LHAPIKNIKHEIVEYPATLRKPAALDRLSIERTNLAAISISKKTEPRQDSEELRMVSASPAYSAIMDIPKASDASRLNMNANAGLPVLSSLAIHIAGE